MLKLEKKVINTNKINNLAGINVSKGIIDHTFVDDEDKLANTKELPGFMAD